MRAKIKKTSLPVRILTGLLIGFAVSLFALSVCALIVAKKDTPHSLLPLMVLLACALGCAAGAFINAKTIEMRGILTGLFSAGGLSFIYIIIIFLCCGCKLSGWLAAVAAVDLLAGAAAGICARNLR